MKAIYEQSREESSNIFIRRSEEHGFRPHFHINVEIYIIRHGNAEISCNGKEYRLSDGNIAFFDSYDIHSYEKTYTNGVDDCVLIVPLKYLSKFNSLKKSAKIVCPVISDAELVDRVLQLIDCYVKNSNPEWVRASAVDLILSLIHEKLEYAQDDGSTDKELIMTILSFMNKNFKNDVSLKALSNALGYNPSHLSRTFRKYMNVGIPEYVNNLRLDYVEKACTDKNVKITELIFDAGFKSIQSYYRNKKRLDKSDLSIKLPPKNQP